MFSMNTYKGVKLNHLLLEWPDGLVLTSNSLFERGYNYRLVKQYVESKWVSSIHHGAYTKLNESPSIYGVLNAVQFQQKIAVHLGGISSLEYYGFAHYSNLSNEKNYYVYTTKGSVPRLPVWLKKLPQKIEYINKKLFDSNIGVIKKTFNQIDFNLSRPERAILELLALVPDYFTLQFAEDNLEGLHLLDEDIVQQLLETCKSIKVKRLFLYLCDEKALPCFKKLQLDKIDLGKGKRVIGEGGKFMPKYKISVPVNDFDAGIVDV